MSDDKDPRTPPDTFDFMAVPERPAPADAPASEPPADALSSGPSADDLGSGPSGDDLASGPFGDDPGSGPFGDDLASGSSAAGSAPPEDDEPTVRVPVEAVLADVGDRETVKLRRPPAAGPAAEDAAPTAAASDPAPAAAESAGDPPAPASSGGGEPADGVPEKASAPWRRMSSAGALIWVLLALFGFTLVVQLRSNDADSGLASARQEDLVRILSDLEARDQRLQQEINTLEESQRQLTSGVAGRQAALAEADKRAGELGLLSGTLPAKGPGLKITIDPRGQLIKASQLLNAVQELRGAGGEVMELVGNNGVSVRIVASSYFVDADGGEIVVDGKQLSGPYTLWVIGVPATMQTALQIPGGVVASVSQAGGNVTMEQRTAVDVAAVRQPASLQYARPVS